MPEINTSFAPVENAVDPALVPQRQLYTGARIDLALRMRRP